MTAFKLPSKSAVYKQIRDVGISRATLNRVLPAWWDDALLQSNSGFLQFAKVLDQRLGLSVSVNDGEGERTALMEVSDSGHPVVDLLDFDGQAVTAFMAGIIEAPRKKCQC